MVVDEDICFTNLNNVTRRWLEIMGIDTGFY